MKLPGSLISLVVVALLLGGCGQEGTSDLTGNPIIPKKEKAF
jgi:hypothetical protein